MIVDTIYTDYMVLQRGKSNLITGKCLDNEYVTVYFQHIMYTSSKVNDSWQVYLDNLEAGGPYELLIESNECQIIWKHIYVGDVFLAAGQSNMEYKLKNSYMGEEYIDSYNLKNIYFFQTPQVEYIENDVSYPCFNKSVWKEANNVNLRSFSAIAFHFVKTLRNYTNIPIGIIECNKGGTSASCWIPIKELEKDVNLKEHYLDQYFIDIKNQTSDEEDKKIEEYKKSLRLYVKKIENYKKCHSSQSISEIKKAVGHTPWPGPKGKKDFRRPGGLYETMFTVIKKYSFAAILWYQGEEDTQYAEFYDILLTLLINRWREDLKNRYLPFFCVQLPNYNDDKTEKWPILREKQALLSEKIANVYLIVTIDCGEEFNIHPIHKEIIGERLGKSVAQNYFHYCVSGSMSTIIAIKQTPSKVFIKYDQPLYYKGDKIYEFEIISGSKKRVIYPKLENDTLIFSLNKQCNEIRYAYKNYPTVNLYSRNGIPVAPFRVNMNKESG